MAFSGTSAFNDAVNTELIALDVLQEAREQTFLPSLILGKDINGQGSLTVNFARFAAISAAGLTETSDLSNTTATTDQAGTITADQVGVRVDITDKFRKIAGGRINLPEISGLVSRAVAAKLETDIAADFTNAGTSVGSTGVDLSLANIEEAIYSLKLAKAAIGNATLPAGAPGLLGGVHCVLHTRQASDLRVAMRAANMAWMTPAEMAIFQNAGAFGSGFMGVFQGVSFWESTFPALSGDSADRIGSMFTPSAQGLVTVDAGIQIEFQRDASARVTEVVATYFYGTGEVADNCRVKIVTDA